VPGDRAKLVREAEAAFDARALFGAPKDGPLSLVAPKKKVADLADWLIARGAEHVTVAQMDYVFQARNELYDRLAARIG
jgi:ATP phosphoribosyltransferase